GFRSSASILPDTSTDITMSIPSLSIDSDTLLDCGRANATARKASDNILSQKSRGRSVTRHPGFTSLMPEMVVSRIEGLSYFLLRYCHQIKKGISSSNPKNHGCAKLICCQSSNPFIIACHCLRFQPAW